MTKDQIKQSITLEQMEELLEVLGAEPHYQDGKLICKTICHNGPNDLSDASHKLYYYDNTKLFRCYTDCPETAFDIFDLVKKKMECESEIWSLPRCIAYVASYFGFPFKTNEVEDISLEDWKVIKKYSELLEINSQRNIDLPIVKENPIKNFPVLNINDWEKEGILFSTIKKFNIKYNPITGGILIPHYDINNNLIGIRERTVIQENEKYGKYKPAIIGKEMYNHPLSFSLYGLNNNKENIELFKTAIIFEGEKSVLKLDSLLDNNISVACCGCNLIPYQVRLLLNLGIKEIVVAFDKQYFDINNEEGKRWIKKLQSIQKRYRNYIKVSFLHDKENLLDYKDSPIDKTKEIFEYLMKNRVY